MAQTSELTQIGTSSNTIKISRRKTRSVRVGDLVIGSESHISTQSMCATKTQDIDATVRQIKLLQDHGADIIRIALVSRRDVEALAEIRSQVTARLEVDRQESRSLRYTEAQPREDWRGVCFGLAAAALALLALAKGLEASPWQPR